MIEAAVVAVLVLANLLNNRWAPVAYVGTSLATTGVLLLLLRAAGLDWADAGLILTRGAWWAVPLVVAVAVVFFAGAALPRTRDLFADRRVERIGGRTLAYQTLVRIPLGTVVLEEVAFRGVVYALGWRLLGPVGATAVSAVLFGLWHVLPSLGLVELNRAAGRAFGARRVWAVVAAVGATALVGVVLCEIRRRTGSLVPVLALHWATNGLGYLVAYLVARQSWSQRSSRPVGI
jgi:membrane protease YdiL (CAAX protease family)